MLRQRVDDFRARILELQANAIQNAPLPELLDELIADFAQALEALDAAEAELREQGEMLDETRDALVREQQRYRQLFEFAPDAYIVTDLRGAIQRVNRAAEALLNVEANELIDKPLLVFVSKEQHAAFRSALMNLLQKKTFPSMELFLQPHHRDQAVAVIATMTLMYEPDGNPGSIYWAFVDITTQKALEEQLRQMNASLEQRVQERTANLEQANQEKDALLAEAQSARADAERANQLKMKLLATVSHELRTPLTSIKGFASTLLAKDVSWEQERWQTFVSVIDDEADKLTELVEQLLDLSRLQAGALSIHRELCPLASAFKLAQQQLDTLAANHQLTLDIPQELPQVSIDRGRIAQVLVNLVGNAAKHSPQGTSIVVSAQPQGEAIEVSVTDQGGGIPEADRAMVFEAFFQSEHKLTRRTGAGLGLAICKGLIERHGGEIWIADYDASGTTICFTLPIVVQ